MATTGQQGAIGVVSATKGEVFAKGADGQMRRLAVGDNVFEGDVIVTANGSTADITPFNGPVLHVEEQQTVAIDAQVAAPAHDTTAGAIAPLGSTEAATVIQNVAPQAGQDFNTTLADEATAAGLAGGDGNQGGRSFVDLMRIVENVPTVGYDFPTNPPGETPIITGQSATPITNTPETPTHGPLANNDYSGLARLDDSQTAHGNVVWNDIPVADAPVHVTSVNGVAVSAEGGTSIEGRFGTLTIDANGNFDYVTHASDLVVWDGIPISGGVTMYGTSMEPGSGSLDIPALEGSGAISPWSVQAVFDAAMPGFGVDAGNPNPSIDVGESLIISLDMVATSVTVSLGQAAVPWAIDWYAYDAGGKLIDQGNFGEAHADGPFASSLTINETTAIKTLVVFNGDAPPFDVAGVAYHGLETFAYTITDSNGAQSTAELIITADQGLDLTAPNGGHIVVGTDNSAIDLRQLVAQFSNKENVTFDDVFNATAEHLSGGSGNDVLSGGPGNDVLTGGGGVDTFVWHLADTQSTSFSFLFPFPVDIVKGFGAGDVLELNDLITDAAKVEVQPFPAGSTPFETLGDATGVVIYETAGSTIPAQVILLEGYTAANTADMAAQIKTTTHFTG